MRLTKISIIITNEVKLGYEKKNEGHLLYTTKQENLSVNT